MEGDDGVADGVQYGLGVAFSLVAAQSLQDHDFYILVVRDADHSAVAPARADGARGVGSMSVVRAGVERIVSVIEIPAMHVVHIAVSVIVDAIVRDFVLIGPDGVFQVRMGNVDTGIDDGYGDGTLSLHRFV